MHEPADLPGYRRRFRIVPGAGCVTGALEDDFHCMLVRLDHDGTSITAVHPLVERFPWTTCPGATAVVVETFTGLPLDRALAPREKWSNCTHLYDIALLAAAHARDPAPFTYDVLVADPDPQTGETVAQVRAQGVTVHRWRMRGHALLEPDVVAGLELMGMREWIATLAPAEAEAARVLQWGSLVAHGRTMDWQVGQTAVGKPPNCFTFQPERAAVAVKCGGRFNFGHGIAQPLDHFDGYGFAPRVIYPQAY